MDSPSAPAGPDGSGSASTSSLAATYLGANGWLLEFGALRLLVDPWLCGPLTFAPGAWLFHAELPQPWSAPEPLDLLLLTQGLPDHCHPPSLSLLRRDLPVVASATAAVRARALGFERVTPLTPGQGHVLGDLEITATAGASVPQLENGYLLVHPAGRLYLEPHGFLAPRLDAQPLDAVITPVVDLGLPLLGAFVRGQQVLPQLLERFQPLTVLASTTGGVARSSGLLPSLLQQQGTAASAAAVVERAGARLIDPQPGQRYALERRGSSRLHTVASAAP